MSGYMGVRNEYYEKLPQYAKGYRDLYVNGGSPVRMRGYVGGEDVIHNFDEPCYAALDNNIAYLVYGSKKARYIEHHNYPKWKGVEDYFILNCIENLNLKAGDELPPLVLVFLPNAGIDKAKAAYEQVIVSNNSNALIFNDTLVNIPCFSGTISASFNIPGSLVPVFEEINSWRNGTLNWTQRAGNIAQRKKTAVIPADRSFEAICTPDGQTLVKFGGEEHYNVTKT